jgi:hypothetical protein
LGCGQLSVGGEVANRVTIKRCYQRQCGAVGVDSSACAQAGYALVLGVCCEGRHVVRLARRLAGAPQRQLADSPRYVRAVLKVLLLFVVHFGLFPVACGAWLDACTLPLRVGGITPLLLGSPPLLGSPLLLGSPPLLGSPLLLGSPPLLGSPLLLGPAGVWAAWAPAAAAGWAASPLASAAQHWGVGLLHMLVSPHPPTRPAPHHPRVAGCSAVRSYCAATTTLASLAAGACYA